MSRHQYDLIQCMNQPGSKVGKVCLNCDGRCPVCDSFVKPTEKVRVCQECSLDFLMTKCILCGNKFDEGVDAYYCLECVRLEKHREGCPRIVNVGSSRSDMVFNKKKTDNKLERLTN